MTTESSFKDVVVWTFISTTAYISLTFLDKSIYSLFGYNFWTIHFIHYFVAFAVLFALTIFRFVNYERIPLANILPLVISESLVSISTSIMFSNGSEQDVVLARSTDFAVRLLIMFLSNKILKFSFFDDFRLASMIIFVIVCSTIAWSTNFVFNKSLLISWPLLTVASVVHYFLAVQTSQKLNVSYEILTMHISGYTSLFILPFALLIKSDSFLKDFEEGFGVEVEPYHYIVIVMAIICMPISFYGKYWLLFKVNPPTYINVECIKQSFALMFKWSDEEFIHSTPTNVLFLFGTLLGSATVTTYCHYQSKPLFHSTKTPTLPTYKMEKGKAAKSSWNTKIIVGLFLTFFIFIAFISRNSFTSDNSQMRENGLKDDHIADWDADDIRLIEHIKKYYMEAPSERNVPYNLKSPGNRYWSAKSQSLFVETYFKQKMNGFFIECGAADGEYQSNTLSLEKYLNWTGLLIEPDYESYQKLKSKNRKSWLVHSCLVDSTKPVKKVFNGALQVGSFAEHMSLMKKLLTGIWQPVTVQTVWCFPLLSILKAVNRTKVDYFVLDVEGPEIAILKNVHWQKVDITLLQIEYAVLTNVYFDRDLSTNRKIELRSFMKEFLPEYKELKVILYDLIYAKNNQTHSIPNITRRNGKI